MKITRDDVYNFFFHPFKEGNSRLFEVASTITVALLTLLTGGMYLVAFGIVNLSDRNITHQKVKKNKLTALMTMSQLPMDSQVKLKKLKDQHAMQLENFEVWAANKDWKRFRPEYSHYDWWAFPIDKPSASYGSEYQLNDQEIRTLKQDESFMRSYRRGVELVVKSWGWDLNLDSPVPNVDKTEDQMWTGYQVRLAKMGQSLKLFGEKDLYQKVRHFYQQVCEHANYSLSEQTKNIFT